MSYFLLSWSVLQRITLRHQIQATWWSSISREKWFQETHWRKYTEHKEMQISTHHKNSSPSPFHSTSKISSINIRKNSHICKHTKEVSVNILVLKSPIVRQQLETPSPDGVKICQSVYGRKQKMFIKMLLHNRHRNDLILFSWYIQVYYHY